MLFSETYIVQVYIDEKNKSKPLQVANEDIRPVTDSKTLKDLDSLELGISPELPKLLSTSAPTEDDGEIQFSP